MLRTASDIGFTGKECEDVALVFPVGDTYRLRDEFRRILRLCLVLAPHDFHRKHLPAAFHQREVQGGTKSGRVDGRRHQDQLQVRPQDRPCLTRERERHVGRQAPLVEFIENDHRNALQAGIVHEPADEDAFRDNLDPRPCGHALLEPHPVTDRLSDGFSQHPGHPLGNLPGGDPPRLQHHDLSFRKRIQDRQRQ